MPETTFDVYRQRYTIDYADTDAAEAEMQELRRQIAEQKQQLAIAEAELVAAEAEHSITLK